MKHIHAGLLTWEGHRGVAEVSDVFGNDAVHDTLTVTGNREAKVFIGDSVGKYMGEIEWFKYKTKDNKFTIVLYND